MNCRQPKAKAASPPSRRFPIVLTVLVMKLLAAHLANGCLRRIARNESKVTLLGTSSKSLIHVWDDKDVEIIQYKGNMAIIANKRRRMYLAVFTNPLLCPISVSVSK